MRKKDTPLSSILVPLFKTLNSRKITYCVNGNYKKLPYFTSHDVDIWTEDANLVRKILYKIARRKNFKIHLFYRTGDGLINIFHRVEEDGSVSFVRIDLGWKCGWRSVFTLVPMEMEKKGRRLFNKFYVSGYPIEAVSKLLYTLISRGKVRGKYKKMIFARRHYPLFFKILRLSLGERPARWLLKQIEKKNWDKIDEKVSWFRFHVIKQNIFNLFIVRGVLIFFKSVVLYIDKYLNPKGIFIVFLGPDGCGKTTLCSRIPEIMKEGFIPHGVKTFYWRPMLLPKMRKLLFPFRAKSSSKSATSAGPESRKIDNYFVSAVRFIYYWFDFVLGFFKFHFVRARGGIVLFDRYYHDFFVYPDRFRLKLSGRLLRMFLPLVPKPDLVFYLDVNTNLLISRKEEISLDELRRQIESYKQLVNSIPNAYIIDGNQPLDSVIKDISKITLNHMSERIEKKYYEINR